MKNVISAEAALGCYLIGSMTDEEFGAWLNGEKVQPAEVEKLKEAVAKFEAVPIQDKIADLKRRLAEKQKA